MIILLAKDLKCILRARQALLATFGFSVLLIVVASFAFRQIGYGETELKSVTPGILWLVFLFSGIIGLNQTFLAENENRALVGLLLVPVSPSKIYFAKFLTNLLYLGFLQIFAVSLHGVFFGVDLFFVYPQLIFITILVAIGFVAIGTLLAGIVSVTRGREVLLPLLLFPVILPLIAGAVFVTRQLLISGALVWNDFWLTLILVFDLISLIISWALFDYVVLD